MWSKNIYILIEIVKISESVFSSSTIVSYFPFDRLHPVYAIVSCDHEIERRLETVELQRFQLTSSRRKWTIDRTTGFQCKMEDCIFLYYIQELRNKTDNKDEELRCWLLKQMKLYQSMKDKNMDHVWNHEENNKDDKDEVQSDRYRDYKKVI